MQSQQRGAAPQIGTLATGKTIDFDADGAVTMKPLARMQTLTGNIMVAALGVARAIHVQAGGAIRMADSVRTFTNGLNIAYRPTSR